LKSSGLTSVVLPQFGKLPGSKQAVRMQQFLEPMSVVPVFPDEQSELQNQQFYRKISSQGLMIP
jgi:hypothetical protein